MITLIFIRPNTNVNENAITNTRLNGRAGTN